MSEKDKFEGKTLSDALDRAAEQFGVPREKIEHKVIKESGGFFGLLGGKVVIEAWVLGPSAPQDIEKKYGVSFGARGASGDGHRHAARPQEKAREKSAAAPAPRVAEKKEPAAGPAAEAGTPADAGKAPGDQEEHHGRRRRRGRRGKGTSPAQPQPQQQEPRSPEQPREPRDARDARDARRQERTPEEFRQISSEPVTVGPEIDVFLKGLFEHIGEKPEFTIEEDNAQVSVRISVSQDSIFSSREGHTIESLKTLLDKAINKGPVIRKRIRVHVSEAVSAESGELLALGQELGRKAKSLMKPISIRGLSPQDRKVFHTALVDDRTLETVSSGDGVLRKLYIVPKGAKPAEAPRQEEHDEAGDQQFNK